MVAVWMVLTAAWAGSGLCTGAWCWEWPTGSGVDWFDVAALSPKEIVAVGRGGVVARWRKGEWETLAQFDREVRAIHANGRNDIWIAGHDGLLARWDGRTWDWIEVDGEVDLDDVYADGTGVIAVGERGRAGVIVEGPRTGPLVATDVATPLHAIAPDGDEQIVVGRLGLVLRSGPDGWASIVEQDDGEVQVSFEAAWTDPDGAVWIGGTDVLGDDVSEIRRYADGAWQTFEVKGDGVVRAIGGSDEPIVGMLQGSVGDPVLYVPSGERFLGDPDLVPEGMRTEVAAIDEVRGAVFAVGGSGLVVRRWKGNQEILSGTLHSRDIRQLAVPGLAAVLSGPNLTKIAGGGWKDGVISPGDGTESAVAIGPEGSIHLASYDRVQHWEGGEWRSSELSAVRALAAPLPGVLWGVSRKRLYLFDGETWTPDEALVEVRTLWARGMTAWVAGQGFAARYDGTDWTSHAVDTGKDAIRAIAADDEQAWFLAGADALWRFDGSELEAVPIPEELRRDRSVRALQIGSGALWVVGSDGMVLRYDGEWSDVDAQGASYLYGAAVHGAVVRVYGRNAILRRTGDQYGKDP